jgi:hypothetical protein
VLHFFYNLLAYAATVPAFAYYIARTHRPRTTWIQTGGTIRQSTEQG